MKQEFSHFDEHYFTRKHLGKMPVVKSYPYYKDTMFNTSHDEIWSRIKGLALYVGYLNIKKENLELAKSTDSLKKVIKRLKVIANIVPIIHNDLGPISVPLIINLSNGAKANSPNKTASTSKCTSLAF